MTADQKNVMMTEDRIDKLMFFVCVIAVSAFQKESGSGCVCNPLIGRERGSPVGDMHGDGKDAHIDAKGPGTVTLQPKGTGLPRKD